MKARFSLLASGLLMLAGFTQSAWAQSEALLGESVTIGCTLPSAANGSVVYSVDNKNTNGTDTINIFGIAPGDDCSHALNVLTPKFKQINNPLNGILQPVTNCGPLSIGQAYAGEKAGAWQAAGNLVGSIAALTMGPGQAVNLVSSTSDYSLVYYAFVCSPAPAPSPVP